MSDKIENKALRQYVYEHIRELIDNEDLRYGEKVNKSDLCKRFKVSQTPVNDALNKLVGENYLTEVARKGYFVKEFNKQEMMYLFEIRSGIEGIAIRLCCERATEEEIKELIHTFDEFHSPMSEEELHRYVKADKKFHRTIVKYSRNPKLQEILDGTGFISRTYQKGLIKSAEDSLNEHKIITNALSHRDKDKAASALIGHLMASRDSIEVELEKNQKN